MKVKRDKRDDVFSKLVRERAENSCEWCGKYCGPKHENGRLDCSHIFSRRHMATRWHPDNAVAHCFSCHLKYGENPLAASRWLVDHFGRGYVDLLEEKKIRGAVLDVWENEPYIDPGLLEKVYLGTPHVAGYSLDGKVNGAIMIYNRVCEHFHTGPELDVKDIIPEVKKNIIEPSLSPSYETIVHNIIREAYDIEEDFEQIRKMSRIDEPEQRAELFDQLRKEYHARREFHNYKVKLNKRHSFYERLKKDLKIHGFEV